MNAHHEAVARIATQVRSFYDRKEHFRIYHGSTNSTRPLRFQKDKIIDTSHLNHVLKIDRLHRTAFCEPNVSMEQLFRECIKGGMVPQVVMEFPGITVGGGFSGTSGESSSFKHGFFENTVRSIEIVLADGQVVKASQTERADLLEAAAGSFGTFGVTTMLEIQLMPAKLYVELDILPAESISAALIELEIATQERMNNDYVDGIVFGKNLAVVVSGQLKDKAAVDTDLPLERFTRPKDEWFYRYVEKRLEADGASPFKITVPLKDYLFRYDRGAFWGGKWAFKYFMVPFNRVTRYLLDDLMHTKIMYHALHESNLANQNIVQDIAFPTSTTEDFINYLDHDFGFYPLWLCPLKKANPSMPLRPRTGSAVGDKALSSELIINVGVWGPGPKQQSSFIEFNRQIERKTRQFFGVKCLYARAYYTEEEFWQIYDKSWYDEMREKYNATTLPSVYAKTKTDLTPSDEGGIWNAWPVAGVYGALSALLTVYSPFRRDYVLEKQGRVLKWYQLPLMVFFAIVLRFMTSVGRAVASLLSLSMKPEGSDREPCLEDFKNKVVYMNSFTVSQKDMLASALHVTGTKEDDWIITKVSAQERFSAGIKEVKEGKMEGFSKLLYTRILFPNGCSDFKHNEGTLNGLLGLPREDLDEATNVVIERQKTGAGH